MRTILVEILLFAINDVTLFNSNYIIIVLYFCWLGLAQLMMSHSSISISFFPKSYFRSLFPLFSLIFPYAPFFLFILFSFCFPPSSVFFFPLSFISLFSFTLLLSLKWLMCNQKHHNQSARNKKNNMAYE